MDLNTLKTLFPKTRDNSAVTGNIPIAYFNANEKAIRAVMREAGYTRSLYRGPRSTNNCSGRPTMTRRCDATSVLFYYA